MKIINISATHETESIYMTIFGLGDDQKIYYWSYGTATWILYKEKQEPKPEGGEKE